MNKFSVQILTRYYLQREIFLKFEQFRNEYFINIFKARGWNNIYNASFRPRKLRPQLVPLDWRSGAAMSANAKMKYLQYFMSYVIGKHSHVLVRSKVGEILSFARISLHLQLGIKENTTTESRVGLRAQIIETRLHLLHLQHSKLRFRLNKILSRRRAASLKYSRKTNLWRLSVILNKLVSFKFKEHF